MCYSAVKPLNLCVFMWYMWLFRKKKRKPGHELDDIDRMHSAETRRLKAELRQLRLEQERLRLEVQKEEWKQKIQELKERVYSEEELEEEAEREELEGTALFTGILMPILKKILKEGGDTSSINPTSVITPPSPPTPKVYDLSDEELRKIKQRIPRKYLRIAKKMEDDELKIFIEGQLPNVTPETVNRAIQVIKE